MGRKTKNGLVAVVIVRGGLVEDVVKEDGSPLENFVVIDHDNREQGHCPVCEERMEYTDLSCPYCGYNEDEDNWVEALRNFKESCNE